MNYLRHIFTENNDFPLKVVNNIIDQEFLQLAQQGTAELKNQHLLQLMISYSGKQGHQLLSKIRKQLKRLLSEDIKPMIT